jgi:hypothetical protein
VCGNFSQGAGTSGTGSDIAFSQLAVKGLIMQYLLIITPMRPRSSVAFLDEKAIKTLGQQSGPKQKIFMIIQF